MKTLHDLVEQARASIKEIMPWDLAGLLTSEEGPLLLDVREPHEYQALQIAGSINVPRGILETACEYNFDETIPELVEARKRAVIVICRSGNRSALSTYTLQQMGYQSVVSLKTGLRGWNDFDQMLVDASGRHVDGDRAEEILRPHILPQQLKPSPSSQAK